MPAMNMTTSTVTQAASVVARFWRSERKASTTKKFQRMPAPR